MPDKIMRPWLKRTLAAGLIMVLALGAWLWTPDKPRSELEDRYLAHPGDLRVIADQRLHLRVSGPADGPALIMLHGFGGSLHTWDGWAAGLDEVFRVIRFDLPGSGLSYADPAGDYSDEHMMKLMGALMDELGVDRAAFIGNSLGGRLAWRMAAAYPERVTALVLVAPDGFASAGFEYGKAPEASLIMNLLRYALPRSVLKMSLTPAYANPEKLSEAVLSRYHDLMLAPGAREALLQRLVQTVLVDPKPLLPQITVPVLLLWGEEDRMIPVTNAADYQQLLRDSQLVRLGELGHLPQEEDARRSLKPVSAFLRSTLQVKDP